MPTSGEWRTRPAIFAGLGMLFNYNEDFLWAMILKLFNNFLYGRLNWKKIQLVMNKVKKDLFL